MMQRFDKLKVTIIRRPELVEGITTFRIKKTNHNSYSITHTQNIIK